MIIKAYALEHVYIKYLVLKSDLLSIWYSIYIIIISYEHVCVVTQLIKKRKKVSTHCSI